MPRPIKRPLAFLRERKKALIAGVIFVGGAVVAVTIVLLPAKTSAVGFLLPFEGKVTKIEYNCLCSGSIMITVAPTEATRAQGAQQVDLLFVWAAPLLKKLTGIDIPVPMAFLWCYPVFIQTSAELLGNYVPGAFPCWEYDGESCSLKGYAQGAIFTVGTSAF